jgi:hypothetical protein
VKTKADGEKEKRGRESKDCSRNTDKIRAIQREGNNGNKSDL